MSEHVTAWLEAYHDGELRGHRTQQVDAHLARCAACRTELERLAALAALLRESPAASDLTPSERFVAQVGLRLPRRPDRPAWQRVLKGGWQLAPLGLLGTWAFAQAVFIVTGVLLVALQLGLGGDLVASLLPAPQGGLWLPVTLNLVLTGVIGLLYWSWLASWWASRQRLQS